ncbi:MAG TPA: hypothetical protein VFI45_07090 [Candidatus Acidoferrum sp.]|nr:hypothetical protein [Candidatus Acidoferrum sp.]
MRLIAPNGELPDINYVEARGDDGSHLSEEKIALGVFRVQIFLAIRYEMQGSGYCSASKREMKTPIGVIDGSETGLSELSLAFPGPGCRKTPKLEGDGE